MPRILIVDDLLSDRRLAGGLLQRESDVSIEYASNGVEALEQIELHIPDLVLTDLQMPEMNGLELVQKIREAYPLIPTILMTARGSEEIAVEAIESGATSYVPKKHLAADLCETVQRVLASAREERSLARLMNRVAETRFVLENDLDLLSSLVSHLRQVVIQRGICSEGDAMRVATSLDEALLNAYYHGNLEVDSELKSQGDDKFHQLALERAGQEPYQDRRISVTLRFAPEGATFVVRDDGEGFNPDDLPDPTSPDYLDRPSGRGLLLMQSFMDEVRFNDVGNEVTLVKYRAADAHAED